MKRCQVCNHIFRYVWLRGETRVRTLEPTATVLLTSNEGDAVITREIDTAPGISQSSVPEGGSTSFIHYDAQLWIFLWEKCSTYITGILIVLRTFSDHANALTRARNILWLEPHSDFWVLTLPVFNDVLGVSVRTINNFVQKSLLFPQLTLLVHHSWLPLLEEEPTASAFCSVCGVDGLGLGTFFWCLFPLSHSVVREKGDYNRSYEQD